MQERALPVIRWRHMESFVGKVHFYRKGNFPSGKCPTAPGMVFSFISNPLVTWITMPRRGARAGRKMRRSELAGTQRLNSLQRNSNGKNPFSQLSHPPG
jgi:hypothetical protein